MAGNNVHFARIEGSRGNQAFNTIKSVHYGLHHHVLRNEASTAQKMLLSLEQGGADPLLY